MSVSLLKSTPATLPSLDESDALATLTPADADRFRIVVTPDADAENPADYGEVGIVGVARHTGGRAWSDSTPDDAGHDPLDLARVLDRLSDGIVPPSGHYVARDAAAEAAIRWARVFHGVTVHRWAASLSQSDYVDALLYLDGDERATGTPDEQAAALEGWAHTLTTWGRGEVSVVSLERNAAEDLFDDSAAQWLQVGDLGPLGGCYLEHRGPRTPDAYDAAACVADYWGVSLDFARAVEVVDDYS